MHRFCLILFLTLLPFLNLSCIKQMEITAEDQKLLFTYQNLVGYINNDFKGIKKCESFTKLSFGKFVRQYGYTFDSSIEKSNTDFLYINSNLQKNISVTAAKQSAKTQYKAFSFGFKLISGSKVTLQDNPAMFTLGDESYHAFIVNQNSATVGNYLVTRVGTYVLQISLVGLYFDEQALLEECLAETIENIRRLK